MITQQQTLMPVEHYLSLATSYRKQQNTLRCCWQHVMCYKIFHLLLVAKMLTTKMDRRQEYRRRYIHIRVIVL